MKESLQPRKIAIIHDWLVTEAGAERVLEQMLEVFPQADLFSLVDFLPTTNRQFIRDKAVKTSFIQRLPFASRKYRWYLPLMPLAVEQFDLAAYDLVISSSHAIAKGVITGADTLHICMCYSPIRYAWELQHQYLKESGLDSSWRRWPLLWLLHYIRLWDMRTANGVDEFIAISDFIRRRINKVYRRSSTVIYPPVDTTAFVLSEAKEDFYLTVSRMVPYKKIDLIVEAFTQMPEKVLVVIGEGPDYEKIRSKAGPNVKLLGRQPFQVVKDHMQRARGFVFAAEEDFGIVALEAQASGTPVIAYGKGGALETVQGLNSDTPSGVFFPTQTVRDLMRAVEEFEREGERLIPSNSRANAERFGVERFRKEFRDFVESCWQEFRPSVPRTDASTGP